MKSPPTTDFYDLSLPELRARTDRAYQLLSGARARVARLAGSPESDRAAAMTVVDQSLETLRRLLPGIMGPPPTLLVRAIRDLTPRERSVLRQAIDSERTARERLARLLGDVLPAHAEDALARVDARETLTAELSTLLRLVERASATPMVA
jgi:hypothetical protein